MLCIAAFILFAILGIFSAKYRTLTAKAWYCVKRRVTFKPCDIHFGEEVKNKLLAKFILRKPRLARFIDRWLDWFAFAFVILTIWSTWSVAVAGLNLYVYDTCDPNSGESCSLSGEACGVSGNELSLSDALAQNKLGEWLAQPFTTLAQTVSRIPDRLKKWDPQEYTATYQATYYSPYDPAKPTALEIIDPGCKYCKKLLANIEEAGFEKAYNLTYLAYPIPDKQAPNGYKFSSSYLIARYLEAVKKVPLVNNPTNVAPDWQLLRTIFTGSDEQGELQNNFNLLYSPEEAEQKLLELLTTIGYSPEEVTRIQSLSQTKEIEDILAHHRDLVENQIRTVRIPTIMFNGRRFDRVVPVEQLR